MNNLDGIRTLSQRLLICLWVALIINPIFNAFLWLNTAFSDGSGDFVAQFNHDIPLPLTTTSAILGFAVSNITVLIASLMLWQLIQLFRLYRDGMIFTLENVKCFKQTANLLILFVLASIFDGLLMGPALTFQAEEMSFFFDVSDGDLMLLVTAVIIRLIAKVMSEAKGLHEEQALTI
ncbi:hypothetical protein BIY22_07290 [Vibrio panuliri]|uniref:DUF2975 domain-containing protein n=1 Tax=Vibrio panuliri TaxID=1381081 RepID=A0A1Q9HE05_9VIBR|nr:DUF2975 domain-containing protein [Vibrio panuliri]OLQ87974.1 hypothetical protein BIY22_07290 [Vibrio panuliri]